jgi:hypothetical protein
VPVITSRTVKSHTARIKRGLDRAGNDTLDVNELRNRIGPGWMRTRAAGPTLVKPSIGPGEVPLRRRGH